MPSDPYVRIALWVGGSAFCVTLLLCAQIVVLRIQLRLRAHRRAAVIAKWRPILNATLVDQRPADLPPLTRAEALDFCKLWLHFQSSLRGPARVALAELAYLLRCEVGARHLLEHGDRGEQLIAILMLGYLRDKHAFALLQRRARAGNRLIAMHACWALMRIDPAHSAHDMAHYLVSDTNWPVRSLISVLGDARAESAPALLSMLDEAAPAGLVRLLRVIEDLRLEVPSARLATLLNGAAPDMLIGALRLCSDPSLRQSVLPLLGHADWRVRLQAAKSMGRIGQIGDVGALAALLGDPQWWVRYRAAQALAGLPFLLPDDLRRMATEADDRYTGDILRQVIAERGGA